MADWEIAKTGGVCAVCGEDLPSSQEYYAGLVEVVGEDQQAPPVEPSPEEQEKAGGGKQADQKQNGGPGFERRDYCRGCWEQQRPEVYCFWKTRLAEPTEKKKLLVDDEVLLSFFERLAVEQERIKVSFRFVLALILMRKRILKYERTELRDGLEFWIMGQVREQKKHEVLNPRLDESHIQEVSEQLSAILHSEL